MDCVKIDLGAIAIAFAERPHIANYWAYVWTRDNAGNLISRMDGQQGEARHYGWDYAWWKGLTKQVRFDLIDRETPWTTAQWQSRLAPP